MANSQQQVQNSSSDTSVTRRVQTEGVFRKCDKCGQAVPVISLRRNLDVCPETGCGHHFQMSAKRRLEVTLDPDSFKELFSNLEALDPLEFKGRRSYPERIRDAQRLTGLKDAVICGEGKIQGQDTVIAVMDFQFIGGSMGSVVGEKISRAIEHATARQWPVIIFCCSGGARMDEGVLSLMQMAKTSAALHRHDQAGLLCVTVLTHPTLAGVSASFAFLGDVIIAEPKAMIGFTGARVIEQTIKKKLPEGFQESEFLLKHGQIDMVTPRKNLRDLLSSLLAYGTCKSSRRMSSFHHTLQYPAEMPQANNGMHLESTGSRPSSDTAVGLEQAVGLAMGRQEKSRGTAKPSRKAVTSRAKHAPAKTLKKKAKKPAAKKNTKRRK